MSADETFASFIKEISSKKNILVLAGAGISVSCGIPDFRSQDGLYNTLNYQVSSFTSHVAVHCAPAVADVHALFIAR
jgi:NAD-dependent SIR2 family protein deacetylase